MGLKVSKIEPNRRSDWETHFWLWTYAIVVVGPVIDMLRLETNCFPIMLTGDDIPELELTAICGIALTVNLRVHESTTSENVFEIYIL